MTRNFGILNTVHKNTLLLLFSTNNSLKISIIKFAKLSNEELKILIDIAKLTQSREIKFNRKLGEFAEVPYTFGLKNIGNTCYMNSSLQCIVNTKKIQEYFEVLNSIEGFQFNQSRFPLLYATQVLFDTMKYNKSAYSTVIQLKRYMGSYDEKYYLYNQEDAFEFFNQYLTYLNGELDEYYRDCKSLYFSNYQVNMTKASSKNLYFNELFHNIQRTSIKCSNCLTEEYCLNSQFSLILNIPKLNEFELVYVSLYLEFFQNTLKIKFKSGIGCTVKDVKDKLSLYLNQPGKLIEIAIESNSPCYLGCALVLLQDDAIIGDYINQKRKLYCFELPPYYDSEQSNLIFINLNTEQVKDLVKSKYCAVVIPNLEFCFSVFIWYNIRHYLNFDLIKKTYGNNFKIREYTIFKLNRDELGEASIIDEKSFNRTQFLERGDNLIVHWDFGNDAFNRDAFNSKWLNPIFLRATSFFTRNLSLNSFFSNSKNSRNLLVIKNSINLMDCIESYLVYTQLTPNQNPLLNWECSNCSSNCAKKTDSFEQLPQYLVINLNRFKSGGVQSLKNIEFIRYSTELELKCNETPVRYKLYAVCNHFGDLGGGHYTSACRNPLNGKWYNFNDIHVDLVSEANVENRNTSLFFFEKQTDNNWKFNFNNYRNMKANLY